MAGFEDCALNIGTVLPAVINHYQTTKEQSWKNTALKYANALIGLTEISKTPGFLPRGVLSDGITHYRNSSVDQYTMATRAFQCLWDWDQISSHQRRTIKKFVLSLVDLLERHNWNIPTEDGQIAWVCESSEFWPGRSLRLLQMVLTAYHISGEKNILELYRKLRDERHSRRCRGIVNLPGYCNMPYFILQEQFAISQLSKLEPDNDYKLLWTLRLHDFAEFAICRLKELYPSPELLQADIKRLSALQNGSNGWQTSYTEQDYADRRNQTKVEMGAQLDSTSQENADLRTAGFCVRATAQNPRINHEMKCVREPLELLHSFLLADNKELIDTFGKELWPIAKDYYSIIDNDVNPQELCAAHSLANLVAVKMQMNS
ncbi:MAG: hypothetical protein BWY69_01124 [Planctomycetes bacterium ADurb.Bin401]|nr:MAG: hypothetical protein BWY69_01124 [Planctomycetes bacterium ADurb.Bin401]